MASSFYAGISEVATIHVFLHFQTHANTEGLFTINVILAKNEFAPMGGPPRNPPKVIGDFHEGSNRIGGFLRLRRGDKWWQLCRDEGKERLGRKLGWSLANEDWWYPKSYEDPTPTIVQEAVADVTFSVHLTLRQLGLPGTVSRSGE
jgi:hypothetical protein